MNNLPYISETFRFYCIEVFELIRNVSVYFWSLVLYSTKVFELSSTVSVYFKNLVVYLTKVFELMCNVSVCFGNLMVYLTKVSELMYNILMLHNDKWRQFYFSLSKNINCNSYSKNEFLTYRLLSRDKEVSVQRWKSFGPLSYMFSLCSD